MGLKQKAHSSVHFLTYIKELTLSSQPCRHQSWSLTPPTCVDTQLTAPPFSPGGTEVPTHTSFPLHGKNMATPFHPLRAGTRAASCQPTKGRIPPLVVLFCTIPHQQREPARAPVRCCTPGDTTRNQLRTSCPGQQRWHCLPRQPAQTLGSRW